MCVMSSLQGFRVFTQMEFDADSPTVNSSKPITFAARRANSGGIVSWSVPLDLQLRGLVHIYLKMTPL